MFFVVVPDRDRFLFLFSVGMCQSIEHIRPNITTVTTFLEFRFVCITKTVAGIPHQVRLFLSKVFSEFFHCDVDFFIHCLYIFEMHLS